MASQQDDACFQAGEAKDRAEEKTGRVMEQGREAAEAAKGTACEAKDRVAERTGSCLQETAEAGKEKSARADSAAGETAQAGQGSFMQQTGEKVMGAAAGAAEAMKNTLGLGAGNEDSH
ncbi:uncharacterized protein LOC141826145 [Curcuma longa]|uniref:uncharacterized protein LOC141826145 n=1 Tax=Curcuma longa TaxID=136217 RepID=UPI003D9EA4DE